MNFETFSVWASSTQKMSAIKARKVYDHALLVASNQYERTDYRFWACLGGSVNAAVGSNPSIRAESQVHSLQLLAQHLRELPGETSFEDEGSEIVLRYTRDSSTGLAYPFSDYCDVVVKYDPMTNIMGTEGTVYGVTITNTTNTEPGLIFMTSIDQSEAYLGLVRDFLFKSLKICERYSGHNLELFLFKLQQQIRALGVIDRLDDAGPHYAKFSAAEVPFSAWFATSNLGLATIKFTPDISVGGYTISNRTFQQLIEALDRHVQSHKVFVSQCIAALNPL